ncbi:M20 aminoacylase family protein [Mixta calida]|uniref:M20 aminoacylase family protein n=1 Tax=Mixta calida TaxID=665913 RepID=UPI00053614B5|nr:M20 aminoacylase family protein [Mixta calida]AIX72578.1 amidohydrolase [Pantoea sp. PSNIH2]POU52202.1 amidohydrolase [Pantoea sp. PSNIH5]POU69701.1 amidohydrolase [Pantoea sp. PSNIH4]POY69792.1 amidohydrolase [Pantoea sp. PSNIH3]MDU5767469.1 M20 aminoacylase family protein [Mixta calida]
MKYIYQHINNNQDQFIALRRDLHQHPELGLEETRTSDMVADKLRSWGYEVHRGMAKTGVVGTLRVGSGEKTLGLRADMDALPMREQNDKPWRSSTENKFHGCGHDGHTATLLCAAEYLARSRRFNGTLHVIFQPGEELLYGGRLMLEDGLFRQFPCDAIYALHNMPGIKKGHIHTRTGAMLASADTLHIEVVGKGGHGGFPEKTTDATLVACQIVLALQTIVSRNVSPFDQAVVTVGSLCSGEAPNIINASALLKLSVRALDNNVRQRLLQRIREIALGQAQSMGAEVNIEHVNGCPALVNDADATAFAVEVARDLFGAEKVCADAAPVMGSEDFAFMLEQNPRGGYLFLGAGDEPERCMVHHPGYDFNDELIAPGAIFFSYLAERFLK